MKKLKGYFFIAIAATLWGASATIVKHLFNIQYPPLIIVQTRVSIAFAVLLFSSSSRIRASLRSG
jgi:drug/metabolite transporter (DMT)-like permease